MALREAAKKWFFLVARPFREGGGIKSLATNQTLFMNYVLKQWTKIVILQYHAGSSVQDSLKWKRYCDFDSNQAPFIALNLHFKENKKCHNSTVQRNEFPSRNRGQAKCESICDFDLIHTQPCVVVQSSIPLPQKKKLGIGFLFATNVILKYSSDLLSRIVDRPRWENICGFDSN